MIRLSEDLKKDIKKAESDSYKAIVVNTEAKFKNPKHKLYCIVESSSHIRGKKSSTGSKIKQKSK